jgi:hypothetical protein
MRPVVGVRCATLDSSTGFARAGPASAVVIRGLLSGGLGLGSRICEGEAKWLSYSTTNSDACTTAGLGIPSIDGLGPRGRGYHTPDEEVDLSSLVPKAAALARFLAGRADGGTAR